MKKFMVTVVWEAVAEVEVKAKDAREAVKKVTKHGLPWRKAFEGDRDHWGISVDPIEEPRREVPPERHG